ncbi:MAG TPA: HU family DNA-binding protein [Candidatus Eremiobacteraceae bacterium]|nr:HU family DNA-binding protein [Candidatus Eremiobacteraceae bacterium]
MTKAELIDAVAEKTALKKRDVNEVVETLLECVKSSLQQGEKVQLIPFGSFEVRERQKREGRNPKTGEKLTIPARRVPAFHAGKDLRDAVNRGKKKP